MLALSRARRPLALCVALTLAACSNRDPGSDAAVEEDALPDAPVVDAPDVPALDAPAPDVPAPDAPAMDLAPAPDVAPTPDVAPAPDVPAPPADAPDEPCPTPGLRRCAGRCVDIASDPTNCGVCGAACTAGPRSTSMCNAGECELTCEAGYADCDGMLATGCETALNTVEHCGSCTRVCAAAEVCISATCRSADMAPAPRPFVPSVGARSSTRRPSFGLLLAPGVGGAEVQVCRDRACTDVASTFSFDGARGRTTDPLPRGLYWWRARSRVGGRAVGAYSTTWWFRVVGRETAAPLAWGSMPDLNGDGLADIVAGTREIETNRGTVRAFFGDRRAIPRTASWVRAGLDGMGDVVGSSVGGDFGNALASVDVNGDGFTDLAVGSSFVTGGLGRAYVFRCGLEGPGNEPLWTLTGGTNFARFGWTITAGTDFDGDGYGDFIVASPNAGNTMFFGAMLLYRGRPTGMPGTPDQVLRFADDRGDRRGGFATQLIGDINGDGFADIAASASHRDDEPGRLAIFAGTTSGLSTVPLQVLRTPGGGTNFDLFGEGLAGVGDVNGDGFDDVVTSAPRLNDNRGGAWLYLGSSAGLNPTPALEVLGTTTGDRLGIRVAGGGDIDGDGFDDFVISTEGQGGRARVYFGGMTPTGVRANVALTATGGAEGFGAYTPQIVGDVNGDGFDDVVVGAPYVESTGHVYLFPGRMGGVTTTPTLDLVGGAGEGLGWSVAR